MDKNKGLPIHRNKGREMLIIIIMIRRDMSVKIKNG